MTKRVLTQKQQTVFEFIQRYLAEHQRSPVIREIQAGCQIESYKSAIDRLTALERKGFIRRTPNKHRGIRLTKRTPEPATPEAVETNQPVGTSEPLGPVEMV